MQSARNLLLCCTLILSISFAINAQNNASSTVAVVPRLVNFSGSASNDAGKPLSGVVGLTFSIYNAQQGGAPLWLETQTVQADARGNYTVQLGAATSQGLPLDLFTSGEARWLGVRVNGAEEQPRVLLLSVPYALKAADAQTVGGLPASAFVLAAPSNPAQTGSTTAVTSLGPTSQPNVGGSGTQNYIPLWTDNSGDLGNSIMYQTGSGAGAKIGINEKSPIFTLDVNGQELVRGLFEMATQNYATKTKAYNSQPLNFESSAFSSSAGAYTLNHFQWQAEPTGNNTTTPGATLNLLYGTDPNQPAETGLSINNKGIFTFAPGQTFPGGGGGTVTSVGLSAPSSDFTVSGSPVTTSGTLGLAWKVAPTNADTANAIVKRDPNGNFSAGQIVGNTIATTSAVNGINSNSSNSFAPGVEGDSLIGIGVTGYSPDNVGVDGEGAYIGVNGVSDGYGVYGSSGTLYGVYGNSSSGQGVVGESGSNTGEGFGPDGVDGVSHYPGGSGVAGFNFNAGDGIYSYSDGGYAGYLVGDVEVTGNLSKGGGSFKIDHPLDPANKYLYHSFVESPDMMNIYNGNAVLNAKGEAVVTLPNWFETLNRDFRYQLTAMGAPGPNLYIAEEISGSHFRIAGGTPGGKVSWMVTGIRQDAWANAHRIPVEQVKPQGERGLYLHPELFGAPAEKAIGVRNYPIVQKMLKAKAEGIAPEPSARRPVRVRLGTKLPD